MIFSHLRLVLSMGLCLGTVAGMTALEGWQPQGSRAESTIKVVLLPSTTVTIIKPEPYAQWLRLRPNAQEGFKNTFGDRPISTSENQDTEAALVR